MAPADAEILATRLLIAALTAVLATFVVFAIANLVPGDPVLAQLGDIAASDPKLCCGVPARWGLNLLFWQQYLVFLGHLLHGDLGVSITTQRPVLDDIAQYAPATLELASVGFALAIIVGIPLGIVAAIRRDSWVDHLARLVAARWCPRRRSGWRSSCSACFTAGCRSRPARGG